MSNLGWYQSMVEVAKKVGGPKNLFFLIFGGGVATGLTGVEIVKIIKKIIGKLRRSTDNGKINKAVIYKIKRDSTSNEGLKLKKGEKIRLLAIDGDAVFIERIDDINSPYVVSKNFIMPLVDVEE